MKDYSYLKVYFDNGLVVTNIILGVKNDETPKEAFENMLKEDDTFIEHNCHGKCEYVRYEELKG